MYQCQFLDCTLTSHVTGLVREEMMQRDELRVTSNVLWPNNKDKILTSLDTPK